MTLPTVLCGLFVACVAARMVYWGVVFGRLALHRHRPAAPPSPLPPVSVIICAFNEANNLSQHLPPILSQDYPDFEVLLVDDGSTDDSPRVLSALAEAQPRLRVLRLDYPKGKTQPGKKHALSKGILAAKHDTLLLTDADCRPASDQWIRGMAGSLQGGVEVGLGYGPQDNRPGFLNAFIRYETIYTAIQYMSLALWGLPYMGVGRNLIYQKKLFLQADGFAGHEHIASGDDDLFVNRIANKSNTRIVTNRETFMYSAPKEGWGAYFKQKSRHVTTGRHYRPIHQLALGILSACHAGAYVFGILSILCGISAVFVISLLGTVLMVKTIVFSIIARKLADYRIIPLIPLLDMVYPAYYVILAPSLMWGKTGKWK